MYVAARQVKANMVDVTWFILLLREPLPTSKEDVILGSVSTYWHQICYQRWDVKPDGCVQGQIGGQQKSWMMEGCCQKASQH
ncbi:hypothetical protein E2C01_022585 [Portunus trituberculatus]|uniref:Uncharacterized protein n=1 Tax=Portunus trituberculatus TaxID=210409 RepID=A0A5B7E7P2_PORTR|nr:hypothetical protein [Portunus trituberculatus]